MSWEVIGATGEWAGALVVVATLFYLSLQIKQQNRAARYNALKDLLDGNNLPNQMLAENAELRTIFTVGIDDPDKLSDEDAATFSWIFRLYWNQMIKLRRAYDAGMLAQSDWEDFAGHFSQLLFSPGGSLFLEEQGELMVDVTEAYREYYVAGEKLFDITMGRT